MILILFLRIRFLQQKQFASVEANEPQAAIQHIVEIDNIRVLLADAANLGLENSPSPELTPKEARANAGRALELKSQCKLAESPLIVVAAGS